MTHWRTGSIRYVLVATASLFAASPNAYEIDTHANITATAYELSDLNKYQSKAENLGLFKSRKLSNDGTSKFDVQLGTQYFDLSGGIAKPRYAATYDALNSAVMKRGAKAPMPRWEYSKFNGVPVPYFPGDWMARGAVREDDAGLIITHYTAWSDTYALNTLDASPLMDRFCNHVYDPINDRGLQLSVFSA